MNISSEMAQRGWNVSDLARIARIDVGTAGDILNGSRWPQRATQNKIEDAIGWARGTIYRWEKGLPAGWDRHGDYPEVQDDSETVGASTEDAGVLLDLPAEALDGLGPAEREEVITAAKLSALATAREIRRRLDG